MVPKQSKEPFTSIDNYRKKNYNMKNAIKITFIVGVQLFSTSLFSQQAPMFTNYMVNTLSVNPAYAGSRDALSLTAIHRSQWLDFQGAPMTQNLTLHAPITAKHIGIGMSLSNDKIGVINQSAAFFSFAYKILFKDQSKLALGLSGGINLIQGNLTSLALDDQNDPAFQANIKNKSLGNFGFGLYYSRPKFYTGISVPNLLQNSYDGSGLSNETALAGIERRHLFFIAGALFDLGKNWALKPTTLVKMTEAAPVQLDVTTSFIYNQQFTIGAMYRTGDAVGILIGMNVKPQFYLGYSFDWSFGNRTYTYNAGSHELVLRYDFIQPGRRQVYSPRYF